MNEQSINSYRDLRVRQDAMSLAESCYRLTAPFPRDELFGPMSQIRRAAASIAANIAEGHGREHTGSFVQSLRVAQRSLKELETHLLLSGRVGILASPDLHAALGRCESVGKMVRALVRSLQGKSTK